MMRAPLIVPLVCLALETAPAAPRIACVTAACGGAPRMTLAGENAFPSLLGRMLGAEMYAPPAPRAGIASGALREIAGFRPDIVFIEPLVPWNVTPGDSVHCRESLVPLIGSLRNIESSPRVVILLPPPLSGVAGGPDSILMRRVLPLLRDIAWSTGCEVADTYSMFLDHPEFFGTGGAASPSAEELIAHRLAALVLRRSVPGFDVLNRAGIRGDLSNYYGYECTTFTFRNREARIVRPKRTAPGCPWIWRARFWGHEPQTEISLLEKGFHVVYCDVAELFGNSEAIALWDSFYVMLRGAGLAPKAALEGLSRGGVYVYRWAVHAPDRVACVYADAPVLDFKSWPGGRGKGGGNPEEWERFKKNFSLATDAEALAFRGNPIDLAAEIARGGYPMLHVCGLADVVVPFEENTEPFEKRIRMFGGKIDVITKPGIGHHPHSLPNPAPIVDFILEATGQPLDP